jgi:hypothetical protein
LAFNIGLSFNKYDVNYLSWCDLDEILADKATPKRQHSAPEYLEKRKQERDRRKSETGLRYRLRRSRKSDMGSSGGGTEVCICCKKTFVFGINGRKVHGMNL